jgi:ferritin
MMISEKMAARLNKQVAHEFHNFWTYKAFGYWFESNNLPVFAKFFFKQAEEEKGHGEKIAKYLIDQGAEVKLTALEAPHSGYKSAKEATELFVKVEVETTKMVHEIAKMADDENDFATRKFIDWKVEEQVEEVATANEIHSMVKYAETPGQLMMLEGRVARLFGG